MTVGDLDRMSSLEFARWRAFAELEFTDIAEAVDHGARPVVIVTSVNGS